MSIFDYDKRHLRISTNSVIFDLCLRESNINILQGDSATGKTLLCSLIKDIKASEVENVVLNALSAKNVMVFDYLNRDISVNSLSALRGVLIIIDNADIILSGKQDLIDFINYDYDNAYLVMTREGLHLKATPNYCGELVYDIERRTFTIKYLFSVQGWF